MALFSLLSLNTFGVPFYLSISRLKRLSSELKRMAPGVICLQEIQQNAYVKLLMHHLSSHKHSAYVRNLSAPKGGLFTASVYPFIKQQFIPFPNQGKFLSIGFSDRWLYKGVLVTSFDMGGREIVVMNTHLQANYRSDWRLSNSQTKIQIDQVNYLAELAHAQPDNAWVIVCGDFNFPPFTPAYNRMVSESGLMDLLVEDPRPTYRPFPLVPGNWRIKLDYLFYRRPQEETMIATADIIPINDSAAKLPFRRFLTDHNALLLTITE
jgi:endonuclease/exonuclease/phosphatase family metal-dependent hydrolase